MNPSMRKRLSLLVLVVIVLVVVYIALLFADVPRSSKLTYEEEDKRVFSIGTLEDIRNNFTVRWMNFEFSYIIERQARGLAEVSIGSSEKRLNLTLIFILPFDADVYYPPNLTILSRPYAKIAYVPVFVDESSTSKIITLDFTWQSFSRSTGLNRFSFDIEGRAFHYLFDSENYTFHPLYQTNLDAVYGEIPVRIRVSLSEGHEYSLAEFHPSAVEDFESEARWLKMAPWLSFRVTGLYEDRAARFSYDVVLRIFPFIAGAVTSLFLREIYEYVKSTKKDYWTPVDY